MNLVKIVFGVCYVNGILDFNLELIMIYRSILGKINQNDEFCFLKGLLVLLSNIIGQVIEDRESSQRVVVVVQGRI